MYGSVALFPPVASVDTTVTWKCLARRKVLAIAVSIYLYFQGRICSCTLPICSCRLQRWGKG